MDQLDQKSIKSYLGIQTFMTFEESFPIISEITSLSEDHRFTESDEFP